MFEDDLDIDNLPQLHLSITVNCKFLQMLPSYD